MKRWSWSRSRISTAGSGRKCRRATSQTLSTEVLPPPIQGSYALIKHTLTGATMKTPIAKLGTIWTVSGGRRGIVGADHIASFWGRGETTNHAVKDEGCVKPDRTIQRAAPPTMHANTCSVHRDGRTDGGCMQEGDLHFLQPTDFKHKAGYDRVHRTASLNHRLETWRRAETLA